MSPARIHRRVSRKPATKIGVRGWRDRLVWLGFGTLATILGRLRSLVVGVRFFPLASACLRLARLRTLALPG
jgi:hypothetical protein